MTEAPDGPVRIAQPRFPAGLLPTGWSWLRLLASPSSFLLVVGLVLTTSAKLAVLRALPGASVAWWPVLIASDLALHLGLAALFALGERRVPWLLAATVPLALVVLALSGLNAAYLGMTGEQLSWQGMAIGIERFGEVWGIVGESLGRVGPAAWAAAAMLLVGVPLGGAWLLAKMTGSAHPTRHGGERARAAGLLALIGAILVVVAPSPRSVPLQRLERSAALATYLGLLADTDEVRADFVGHVPLRMVDDAAIRALAGGPRPSVVVVVLESTRYDVTSLAGGPARTPALEAIAARGTEVVEARAVLPHTTKSLWSILCGRLPLMQLALYETSFTVSAQCLPHVLAAAGYRTAFLQSSLGAFEDRPRLVANLGFGRFAAWEDIGGEPLGYLASDDESLAAPLFRFVDEAKGPFLAVLLTSATHHPYRLSRAAEARAAAAGAPRGTVVERYHRLVEAEDALVAAVVAGLAERGLSESTIVVALGDHGEGFGDKGVKQHDTNFFEEGLRVPWVMAGPGIPEQRVRGAASLLDVTPSLLDALGVPLTDEARAALAGASLLAGAPPAGPRPFGCWFDGKCRGYVEDEVKVVAVPEAGQAFAFDLDTDPGETRARPLGERERSVLGTIDRLIERHRTGVWPLELGALDVFTPWSCPAGAPCRHPRSPPGGLFGRE